MFSWYMIISLNSNLTNLMNNHLFVPLTANNIDNFVPSDSQMSLGYGLFDNQAYVSFNIAWIILQFKIDSSAIHIRKRYSNNGWSSWRTI